jgi:hypothetical protein
MVVFVLRGGGGGVVNTRWDIYIRNNWMKNIKFIAEQYGCVRPMLLIIIYMKFNLRRHDFI